MHFLKYNSCDVWLDVADAVPLSDSETYMIPYVVLFFFHASCCTVSSLIMYKTLFYLLLLVGGGTLHVLKCCWSIWLLSCKSDFRPSGLRVICPHNKVTWTFCLTEPLNKTLCVNITLFKVLYCLLLLCPKPRIWAAFIITYCISKMFLQVLNSSTGSALEMENVRLLQGGTCIYFARHYLSSLVSPFHTLSSLFSGSFFLLTLFWIPSGMAMILCLFSVSAWLTDSCGVRLWVGLCKIAQSLRTAMDGDM